jgi:hypothetical protein
VAKSRLVKKKIGAQMLMPVILASQGSRDQEDCSLKPDPISKMPNTKRAGGVAQGLDPEFKPQYGKKGKKRK